MKILSLVALLLGLFASGSEARPGYTEHQNDQEHAAYHWSHRLTIDDHARVINKRFAVTSNPSV